MEKTEIKEGQEVVIHGRVWSIYNYPEGEPCVRVRVGPKGEEIELMVRPADIELAEA